jgi:hypothetical protein
LQQVERRLECTRQCVKRQFVAHQGLEDQTTVIVLANRDHPVASIAARKVQAMVFDGGIFTQKLAV